MTLTNGRPYPPGGYFDGQGVNFSLFSAHAEKVELCLFNAAGEETRLTLPARSGSFWHGYLADAQPGQLYGYRVYGPWAPQQGHYFNPQKLLIDPYTRALTSTDTSSPLLADGQQQPDQRDSAAAAPKSVIPANSDYNWQNDSHPRTPWSQTIIYEAHVRGLSQNHPDIPADLRGSYAALAHPLIIEHLQQLGITALELLPVQLHLTEPHLQQLGLSNYWGYNVLAPFAIAPDYWSGRANTTPLSELRDAVKALHAAGIEVILDVVFNHTAELDHQGGGPTLTLRGIDNLSYYWLDENGDYLNWSGCGNVLRLSQPQVLQLVMDCLRYWVSECHIDGFRFDLGATLGRQPQFSAESALFSAIRQDPILADCKLIAEPWDLGPNGYQLGQFPAPFAEWNDHFRDGMRQFWLTGALSLGEFARRFSASSDYFQHSGRQPSASINLITAHDGFTLRDLISFNHKHNQLNGENNLDGHNNNFSNNHGVEGLTADQQTQQNRQNSQRALLTSLLLASGTPQLLSGDELGHSQQGNNNAYCQDNNITWIDWSDADLALIKFTARLIELRKQIPALNQPNWWQDNSEDVSWLNAENQLLSAQEWQQHPPPLLQIQLSTQWLLLVNNQQNSVKVVLPAGNWQYYLSSDLLPPATQVTDRIWYAAPRSMTVLKKYSNNDQYSRERNGYL